MQAFLCHRCVSCCSAAGDLPPRTNTHSGHTSHTTLKCAANSSLLSQSSPPFTSRRQAMQAAAVLLAQPLATSLSLWGALGPVSPEPIRFPRKNLDLRFAVLLMRSSYDVVDDLDFVAMCDLQDQFQIDFWKLRAAEYEPYMLQYSPLTIKAGDLTDPLYFDFISFAQYATIAKEIPKAKSEFEERCEECEGFERRSVVRDAAALGSLEQLPSAFQQRVADRIYSGLRDGFRGEQFGGPPAAPPAAPITEVARGVQQLMDVFVDRGYALKAEVTDVQRSPTGPGGSFTVHLEGPANLWGVAALASRRSLAINAFDALAIEGFLRASNRQGTYELRRTDTYIDTVWQVV